MSLVCYALQNDEYNCRKGMLNPFWCAGMLLLAVTVRGVKLLTAGRQPYLEIVQAIWHGAFQTSTPSFVSRMSIDCVRTLRREELVRGLDETE